MRFVCYTAWDQLPESANALFTEAEKTNLFYSRPWFENLTSALDEPQSIRLACVVSDNCVHAILPLIQLTENGFSSLKHRYTTHYNLLISETDQLRVLNCLVQGLEQLPLHSLLLEPIAEHDPVSIGLQQAMQQAGYQCERYFRLYNWIYRIQGQSFEDYMATRPARLRNTISRKRRKLEREHGYEIRLFIGDEVPHAMHEYYAVYTASWKANEQYVDFMDGVVAGFSGPGWSRLGVLYVNGKPIAAQLWFVVHQRASIFRLAYDEKWKPYSPGSILTHFLMEYVINTDKVVEIDFLTGNEAYKQDWMSERRERIALSFVKNTPPARWHVRIANFLKLGLKRP